MPHKNPEKKKEYSKEWYQRNKEKHSETCRKWREKNPEKRSKYNIISAWKYRGLICDDYNELYENYLKSTHCEECGCEYGKIGDKSNRFKCMDHNHVTGLFRNFLCNRCNLERR